MDATQATSIVRECAEQSRTLGSYTSDARADIRAWRREAHEHGDTLTVEAIDTLGLDRAAAIYAES